MLHTQQAGSRGEIKKSEGGKEREGGTKAWQCPRGSPAAWQITRSLSRDRIPAAPTLLGAQRRESGNGGHT